MLENAGNQHFLLFQNCFLHYQRQINDLTVYQTTKFCFDQIESICRRQNNSDLKHNLFLGLVENTVGKGEIAHTEEFLLFTKCFLLVCQTFCHLDQNLNCRLQTFSLEESKNCRLVEG